MKPVTKAEFLERFPVFRTCPDEFFSELLPALSRNTFPKDHAVYAVGDSCPAIPFLLSGEIRVYKISDTGREITLYEVLAGETCILNASCILSRSSYPAHAASRQDGEMLLLPADTFRRLTAHFEEMRIFIFDLLNRRLATVIEVVEEVAFGKLDARLLAYIREKAVNGELRTTHRQIANDLGTSREVVSRLLEDFEQQGAVVLTRSLIRLIQP